MSKEFYINLFISLISSAIGGGVAWGILKEKVKSHGRRLCELENRHEQQCQNRIKDDKEIRAELSQLKGQQMAQNEKLASVVDLLQEVRDDIKIIMREKK